jgi:osmotically-inducible protein OsmY
MKRLNQLLLFLICAGGLALAQMGRSPAPSQAPNYPTVPNDPGMSNPTSNQNDAANTQIRQNIEKGLQQEASLASTNIKVKVTDGKVELKGTVSSDDARKTAEQIAQSNANGYKVVDHLKVANSDPKS